MHKEGLQNLSMTAVNKVEADKDLHGKLK
jgi:hypothetical protein